MTSHPTKDLLMLMLFGMQPPSLYHIFGGVLSGMMRSSGHQFSSRRQNSESKSNAWAYQMVDCINAWHAHPCNYIETCSLFLLVMHFFEIAYHDRSPCFAFCFVTFKLFPYIKWDTFLYWNPNFLIVFSPLRKYIALRCKHQTNRATIFYCKNFV